VTDDDDGLPHASRGRTRLAGAAAMCRPNFALLVLVVGLLGLIQDSLPKPAPASWMNLHVLFGALLWVCVVARFYRGVRRAPRMLPAEVRALSRQLSRLVYLLLYALIFFGLIIGILGAALHGAIVGGAENFQSYLVGGLVALVTIRALAALYHRFVIQGHHFVIKDGMSAPVEAAQRNGRLT
jgi:cytochrome b561